MIRETFRNPFVKAFVILYIGYLSLSFLGVDNKSLRIVTSVLTFLVLLSSSKVSFSTLKRTGLFKALYWFVLFMFPSALFSDDIGNCAFKLFEATFFLLFVAVGVRHFKIKNFTLFHVCLCYYVLQTIITLIGYYFDPTVIAEDNGYGAYVTYLSCKYPPLHSNGLGAFAGTSMMFALVLFKDTKGGNVIKKVIPIIIIVASLCVLYLTSSRTSMLSCFVGVIYLIFRIFNKGQRRLIFVFTIFLGVVFSTQIVDSVTKIMMKKQTDETLSRSGDEADLLLSGRLGIWEKALDNPENCIVGLGYGTAIKTNADKIGAHNAHNSVVELLLSVGIFATISWFLIFLYAYTSYIWLMKRKEKLPFDVVWYHLGFSLFIMAFIRSFGNISFVYFDLSNFALLGSITLFVYSTLYIKDLQNNYVKI